jgi:hypothetical protein
MNRIFLTLASLSILLLVAAFSIGLNIGDAAARDPAVQKTVSMHMLVAMGALIFSMLLHAIVFTYFIGTGRWIEETSEAYELSKDYLRENQKRKYRLFTLIVISMTLLVVTGALGALADPASPMGNDGWMGIPSDVFHLICAGITLAVSLLVYLSEYQNIVRNGELINEVMQHVNRIRKERGLPV